MCSLTQIQTALLHKCKTSLSQIPITHLSQILTESCEEILREDMTSVSSHVRRATNVSKSPAPKVTRTTKQTKSLRSTWTARTSSSGLGEQVISSPDELIFFLLPPAPA